MEEQQYRVDELARLAGITVRTLRFYRERRLIPPPRREGRIAWYDDRHLDRLRTISALLERGHTLSGIAELAEAFDNGRDVGDLLGLGAPTEETPVRLTPEELFDYFADDVTPENLAAALDLGYLGTSGTEFVHVSRRLLDLSSELVGRGIPLAEVLRGATEVRRHAEALVTIFADMALAHASLEEVQEMRPMAKSIVEAELSMAMDRRFAEEFDKRRQDAAGRRPQDGPEA
ncbi:MULTISPECIES: MerR family transcriptional regulator [Streptomyces]|uniref:MerR family transcriptional regulator n=1 Tax=Streptomyces albus (strain ATCC 21838 / DSM 41398 / FERM P-419 / JCM 4703 / NBRC 107858) TaxID=1081613 RepID=A0A0B5F398_STRA4|nr:MerR family transcriptional regulator [Streptomyces sp. SCSIO ZS0520]AJE84787.1 merR family transcriptional regulator [Streptomyces albus]AOU79093.1 merR family transcriptional regulator [Streptomyces albus]AYN34827.1 MerR family transcriptional regulator [Streptomyces albus]